MLGAMLEKATGWLRNSAVHLSIAVMFGVVWFAAWAQSVDVSTTNLRFPALREDQIRELEQAHADSSMRASAQDAGE